MFLHLGNGVSVRTKDVIAIHDYALFMRDEGAAYLAKLKAEGQLVDASEENGGRKSFVLTTDKAYLSILSATTLARRSRLEWDKE